MRAGVPQTITHSLPRNGQKVLHLVSSQVVYGRGIHLQSKMALWCIVHVIDQRGQRSFERAPVGDRRVQTENVSTEVADDRLKASHGSHQLRGDILVAGGHETLASLQTESEREKGLDGAVVEVLGHALAFIEHLTELCLALTQCLFGPERLF